MSVESTKLDPFAILPVEISVEVLSYLIVRDHTMCSQVNRNWRALKDLSCEVRKIVKPAPVQKQQNKSHHFIYLLAAITLAAGTYFAIYSSIGTALSKTSLWQ